MTSPETQELEEEQQGVGVCCRLHRVSPHSRLKPQPPEYDPIWKYGLYRVHQVPMRSPE